MAKQAIHGQRQDVHIHFDDEVVCLFREMHRTLLAIHCQGEKIMATQAELTAQVNAANEKLKKVGTETSSLLKKIDELASAIANGPAITPELQAAVDALTAQADVVDGLVPDAPPAP